VDGRQQKKSRKKIGENSFTESRRGKKKRKALFLHFMTRLVELS